MGRVRKPPPRRRRGSPKPLDKLETLLRHTQGDNPPGFDYAFNLTYGAVYTQHDPTIAAIRSEIDAETRSSVSRGRISVICAGDRHHASPDA